MSDDSDHASSPGNERAKRPRTERVVRLPPILAFESMGPDQTTTDPITQSEASDNPRSPHEPAVLQTTEEIGRLQLENIRLRVELDELRRQLREQQTQLNSTEHPQGPQTTENSSHPSQKEPGTTRGVSHEEIRALRREIDNLKHANARLEADKNRASAVVADDERLNSTMSALQEVTSKFENASQEFEQYKTINAAELESARAQTERLRASAADMQARTAHAEQALREQIAETQALTQELESAIPFRARINDLEAANAALRQTIAQGRHAVESEIEAQLNNENEQLKDMLVDLGVHDHERGFELEALSDTRRQLSSKLEATEKDRAEIQAKAEAQSKKIVELEASARSNEVLLRDTQHQNGLMKEALALKDSQIAELRDENQRLSGRSSEQAEQISYLNTEQGRLQRLSTELKQRTQLQDTSITEQSAEIRTLHRELKDQNQALEDIQSSHEALEVVAEKQARSLDDREQQMKHLKKQVEQLESVRSQLEGSLKKKSEELDRQVETTWQQKRSFDEYVARMVREHSEATEKLKVDHDEKLANQLGAQHRLVEELRSNEVAAHEKHNKELQKLRAQVATLRADAITSESEHGTARALLEETRAQLNQTLQTLDDLQARSAEERSRFMSEKHRYERYSGELEAKSSRLQTEMDELRRKDKAVDDRVQKLEQTLVDQSMELRQLKLPRSGEASDAAANDLENMRREYSSQSALWERMRDEMMEYINRINTDNSALRAELDRWQSEETQRTHAIEESLKKKFVMQTEQLESLASFKENAQTSLVNVAQEDLRKVTEENLAMRREHVALYERAETLEMHANQAAAELTRITERLSATTSELSTAREEGGRLRQQLKLANDLVSQSQQRAVELENRLEEQRAELENQLTITRNQNEESKVALQVSEKTAKNLRISVDVMESKALAQAESTQKYLGILFYIMRVDRRRILDLTFVKKHLMTYYPPPVGVFPVMVENGRERRKRSFHDVAVFALAVSKFKLSLRHEDSRLMAQEYEKQLRTKRG